MRKITLKDLKKALEKSWSKKTSFDPNNWTPENPAWGQCAVTALIVQDYFGGSLKKALFDTIDNGKAVRISHYWNRLPNDSEIDLTENQFPEGIIRNIPRGVIRDRKYVLSYPITVKRYEILKQRVEKYLKEKRNERNILYRTNSRRAYTCSEI